MIKEIKNGKLFFDGCDTTELAKKYGTPLYVMSASDIESRFDELNETFVNKYPGARVAYASKAFCTTAMYKICEKKGASIDIVSGGELAAAEKAGFPAERIEFNGNNKLEHELADAVEYGVGRIIVDGLTEIPLLEKVCKEQGKKVNVLLRITPGVAASTHDYIITGKKDSKFGIPLDDDVFYPIVKQAIDSEYVNFLGLHMHIGSQLFENEAFLDALDVLLSKVEEIKKRYDYDVTEINLGGGFGVVYTNEVRKPYSFFLDPMMEKIAAKFGELGIAQPAVVIEPGRSIVAEAGITLYSVGQVKDIRDVRNYVSIDGGMGDNIRTALYQAEYTGCVANKAEAECTKKVTICGKCCESGDIIINDFMVPEDTTTGDIIAVYSTGAYCYAMASNYNFNTIPGVVMVKEGKSDWIVKPQTYEQILQNQVTPDWV